MWFGVSTYLEFWQYEAWPLIRAEHPLNSAPFIYLVHRYLVVAFIWLAAAVFFWAFRLSKGKCDCASTTCKES